MKLRKITPKNKKAQLGIPIVMFIVVVIALLLLSPFILKIFNAFLDPFGEAVGNITEEAGTNVAFVADTFVGFWDFVVLIAFLINLILLLISAFLVDTHTVFLILFILFGIFIFIFAPEVMKVVDEIYDSPQFALEVSQAPMIDFVREYFTLIILGIFFVCGIIIYSKFRWGGQPK